MVETSLKGQNGSRLASSGILVQKPRAASAVSGPRRTRVPNLRSSALRESEPPQHPFRRPGNGMNASRLVRHQDGLFGRSKRRPLVGRVSEHVHVDHLAYPLVPRYRRLHGAFPHRSPRFRARGLTTDRMSAPGEVSLNPRAGTPPTPTSPRAGWAVAKAVERRHGARTGRQGRGHRVQGCLARPLIRTPPPEPRSSERPQEVAGWRAPKMNAPRVALVVRQFRAGPPRSLHHRPQAMRTPG
jgi:hypothetical protein